MNIVKTINFLEIFTFVFICGTIIFPAFAFMKTNSIHYIQYVPAFSLIAFVLTLLLKKSRNENVVIDWLFIYLVYYFVNNVIIHGPPEFSFDILYPILLFTSYGVFRNYTNENVLKKILITFIVLCSIESFIGMSQVLFGEPQFEHLNLVLEEDDRNYFAYFLSSFSKNTLLATGTFLHFNTLGSFLVIGIPIAYALFIKEKKNIYIILTFIIFLGIIFTFSRGSLIGAFLALSILYFKFTRGKFIKMYIAFWIVFVGALILESTVSSYVQETGHASPRFDTWSYSLEYGLKQPINLFFGYGLLFFKSEVLVNKTFVLSNVHNTFLMIFLEQGIIGLTFFLLGIHNLYKRLLLKRSDVYSYLLLAIATGFLFTQIFDHAFFGPNGLLFFIMVALLQSDYSSSEEKHLKIQEQEP